MSAWSEIEADLNWRESELGLLKILINNQTVGEREKVVLYRAAWALLYAHYEGFCKFALTVYYDSIKKMGKNYIDLPQSTKAFALDKELKILRNLSNFELLEKISTFETDVCGVPASFPDVDTQSNLWPNILDGLLKSADIVVPSLGNYSRSISALVGKRNKIAHGARDVIPDYTYYLQHAQIVQDIMYELALVIDEKLQSF